MRMRDTANKHWPEMGTRDVLRDFLVAQGYPLTKGTLNQLCAPARGEGPPSCGFWGRRKIYNLRQGLEWARERVREKPYAVHPQATDPWRTLGDAALDTVEALGRRR